MLKIIEIVLKAKADEEIQKAEKSLASIMNDVLMQYVDDKYREYLSTRRSSDLIFIYADDKAIYTIYNKRYRG